STGTTSILSALPPCPRKPRRGHRLSSSRAILFRSGATAAPITGPSRISTRQNFQSSVSFSRPRPKPVRKRTVEAGGTGGFVVSCSGARGPVLWLGKRILVRQQLRLLQWVTGLNRSRGRALHGKRDSG